MKIEFTVNQIGVVDGSDPRAKHFPEGSAVNVLRLRPVEDTHRNSVGDIVIVALAADCNLFMEEIIDRAPLVAGDGRKPEDLGKVLTPGTSAVLTIG